MPPVRLQPATPRFQFKHSTTEPLAPQSFGLSGLITTSTYDILYVFLGTVKAAPCECVIRTGQP